jgi:hypothetical protein
MSVFRILPLDVSQLCYIAAAIVACFALLAFVAYEMLKSIYKNTTPELLAQQVIDFDFSSAGDGPLNSGGPSTPPAIPKRERKLKITRTPEWHKRFGTSPVDSSDKVRPVVPPHPAQSRASKFDLEQAAILRRHMRYPMKMDEASRLVAHNKLQTLWDVDLPNLRPLDAALHANRVVQLAFIPGGDEKDYRRATVSVAAEHERSLCTCTRWNLLTWFTSWVSDHLSVRRHFQ